MPSKETATILQRRAGRKVVEPFQHPPPKLVMAPPDMQPWKMVPPSLSPLHMSPPCMELPDFSPIQDHMPLPTLSASTFIPPQSFLTHHLDQPPSVLRFSRADPSLMAAGSSAADPDPDGDDHGASDGRPMEPYPASVTIFRVEDVEREVRGDAKVVARGVYPVRMKVRPRLHEMAVVETAAGVLDLAFAPYEPELLVAALATGELVRYRVRAGRYTIEQLSTHAVAPPGTPVHALVFSPTAPTLAAASCGDGAVRLLAVPRPAAARGSRITVVATLPAHAAPSLRACFSADGRRLYTGGSDGSLAAWKTVDPARSPAQQQPEQPRWTAPAGEYPHGVSALLPWPAPFGCGADRTRRTLLVGAHDGTLRMLDLSTVHVRPPLVHQSLDLHGVPWHLAPLPPLPVYSAIDELGAGAFTAAAHPDVELDPEIGGALAAAGRGGARVLIFKQKFEEVFLPRRDGSDIVDWTTRDGVPMDHEGREKQYWWYDLADIEEHGNSSVRACDATVVIDYDPLFKDAGEQRLRRGWRLASASRDGTLCFWQVYVE